MTNVERWLEDQNQPKPDAKALAKYLIGRVMRDYPARKDVNGNEVSPAGPPMHDYNRQAAYLLAKLVLESEP